MSKRWANGSTPQWRRVRAYVLQRDGRRCQLRLPRVCKGLATQVHHTQARELVGDDPAHLVAACGACNGSVGDPTRHDPDPQPRAWWDDEPA
jgi:5-methylcytosine-specific restriction endonuclease McrA